MFTTIVPLVLLVVITFIGLVRKLGATSLQFLRREITHRSKRSGMALPERLRFVTRFRLRVFVRNFSHFATLFFGIMFGSLLLLFGLAMMPLMNHFAEESAKGVPAEHLYVLKAPVEIDVTASEREAMVAADVRHRSAHRCGYLRRRRAAAHPPHPQGTSGAGHEGAGIARLHSSATSG